MLVMGIDSSTSCTGWSIIDNEENKIIAHGCIKPSKKLNNIEKIIYITRELKSIQREHEPEYICIEETAVLRNAKTQRVLTALLYYIVIEFTKLNCLIITLRPSEWRKGKIKGKNRSDLKANCINYVKKKYNIVVNDDEADAIVIAEYDVEKHEKTTL